jgi:hypothetical protein
MAQLLEWFDRFTNKDLFERVENNRPILKA